MGAIDKNSFVWASLGIEPPLEEDAIYEAGEQPIAGFDNYVNWAITTDIDNLNDYAGNHGHEHEAGGSQQINLSGLSVGGAAKLVGSNTSDETEFRVEHDDGSGTAELRIDMDDPAVRALPEFAIRPTFREGIDLGQHVTRDGEVIYDYNEDIFHRAAHALEADLAFDSDRLEGYTLQEILDMIGGDIEDSFPAVEDNGTERIAAATRLNFGTSIDVDADGSTATMSVESVPHAEMADLALNSELLENHTVQDILDLISDDIEDSYPAVEDNGEEQIDIARRFNFGTSIDVTTTSDTARMDVESVPHSEESEYAFNADRVDNYHASDLIAMMGDGGRWRHIGDWQIGPTSSHANWQYTFQQSNDDDENELFDRYRMLIVHENMNSSGASKYCWTRVNGDTRNRYDYVKRLRDSHVNWEDHRWETTKDVDGWALAEASKQRRTVAEYEIACPDTMGLDGAYPYVSEISYNGGVDGRAIVNFGQLRASYDQINSLSLETGSANAAVYIKLWGANIFQ